MNQVLLFPPVVSTEASAPKHRLRHALARLWQRLSLDEREAYLSKATDCADLERRMRAWDRRPPGASGLHAALWG